MASANKQLKILCLHGYMQNADVFRKRTGAFRKMLKKQATFEFVTAPHQIPSNEDGSENITGWWFSTKDKSYMAQDVTDFSEGLDASFEIVADALKNNGPFDGILGFSQGASLLSMICALKQKGDLRFQDFKFAIIVAGYKSRQTSHAEHYSNQVAFPTLHVIGDTDQVIQRPMSDDLLTFFDSPTVVRHGGGHFIPSTAAQKQDYVEFLKQFS